MSPEAAMRLALTQARASSGRTWPNPPVGAVVFRGDRVLARGRTRPPGGAHAEVVAIEGAIRRHGARAVRGASLAVTLEPCNHQGRTGPCTERILAAGIARVYAGHLDPHRVAGGGVARLRRAGVAVEVGVLEAECREQHRGFLSLIARGRPFVSLKLAASLDGRIATARGESRWISSPESRVLVHRLRSRTDAVLVGAGTARADDPELTARRGDRVVHRPVRVLVDSRLRVPLRAKLYRGDPGRTWVLCGRAAAERRGRALERRGVVVLPTPRRGAGLDLARALRLLGGRGLSELLVEGGGGLAAALLRAGLVDELHWFAAPRLIGGDGLAALGPLGVSRLAHAPRFDDVRVRRVGRDVYLTGRPAAGEKPKP